MTEDSHGDSRPEEQADAPSGQQSKGQATLLGHASEADDAPVPDPAPRNPTPKRGKGQPTIPGGSPGRGQYWGKVAAGKTKMGLGEEATVPIAVTDGIADPITQELMLDEIQDVKNAPPVPKRKAPPRRPPPSRRPGTRPPPPKRESDKGSKKPPARREQSDGIPPSRPAPPRRPEENASTKPPRRKRSEPPPKRSERPAVPTRSEAPKKRADTPPPLPKPSEPRAEPPAATPSPAPVRAAAPGNLEEVPLPSPSLRVRSIPEVCRTELALEPDVARAARLHFELGQSAPDATAALKSYGASLESNSAFLPTIRAARALNLASGNMTAASKLFATEIALIDEPRDKAQLHFLEGGAWLDVARDPDKARDAFRAAVQCDPNNVAALKALQHAELRAKDWSGLAHALELEANAVLDDRRYRAAVLVRHARLLERRLRKPEAAIEKYELALELDPQTPTALAELKRLLFGQERWQELIAAHERAATLTRDVEVQAQAFWNVGRIYSERLAAHEEAIVALEKAAKLKPREAMLLDELARLYVVSGNLDGAASALERLAAAVSTASEKLSALHRLGELFERSGGREADAVRWYEATLAVDAGFTPALRALDQLYRKTQNWTALAAVYAAEGGSNASSSARAAAHARAAEIFDAHMARPDDAVRHYEQALALDPEHEGAFKSLVGLHTAAKRHRSLIELYDRAIDIAAREEIAVAYMFKIGALYEDVLGEPSGATATYVRILERQPDNLSAIHAMQRTSERAGRFRDLVDALDREVSLEKTVARVLMLQHRAAMVVHERLGDAEGALARLRSVLGRNPKHAAAIASMASIFEGLGQPRELLQTYELQLAITPAGATRVALLIRMADLCEIQLGDIAGAVAWYNKAVAAEPANALARAALTRLLRAKGDHKELARVLTEEVESAADPERMARAALLLGEVYEVHLSRPVDAVVAYKAAIEALPGYQPALDALARVHSLGAAWKELADTFEAQAGSLQDERLATDAKLRAAALRADRLGRNAEAATTLTEVAAADTNNLAALLALEALHVEDGQDGRLAELLDVQAEVFASPMARVAAMVEHGRLLQRANADGESLRPLCVGVLASDPTHPWALSTLEKIAIEAGDAALLADVDARLAEAETAPNLLSFHQARLGNSLLQTNPSAALTAFHASLAHSPDNITAIRGLAHVGTALGDARSMVDSYRREAAFTRDDAFAADLLVQSAAVQARLGDRASATQDAESALERSADHELAARMLTALLGTTELDRLIERLSQAAHNTRNIGRRVALWQQVGDLYARGKKDVGSAMSAVKRALASLPEDVDTMLQMARLYIMDSQHREAAELLTKAVRLDDGQLDAHLELARIYTEHLSEPARARTAIDKLLASDPEHREALRLLLTLHLAAGDREDARAASDRLLAASGDDATRAWAFVEIARVELNAKDHERAADALHEAVVITGLDGEAAKLYKRLGGDALPWKRYTKTLEAHLASGRTKDSERVAAVYLEIARTQSARLNNSALAFRTLDKALDKVGDNAAIVLERAEMLAATGRTDEATSEFAALVSRSPYVVEAWRGLTQVLQQQGRQGEAAVAASPLVLLGEANEVEKNLAANHEVKDPSSGAFVVGTMRSLSAGGADGDNAATSVFASVADGVAKLFPVPYDLYGVRKGDRIKARSGHPVRNDLDRLMAVFGLEDVDLYMHTIVGGDVSLELSNPPSIMAPAMLTELPEAQRVFLLARPLAAIAAGVQVAYKLSAEDVAMIVAAAVRRLYPTFEEGDHDAQQLAVWQDKLSPSWFSRGRVDEVIHRYYAEPIDVAKWASSAERTATRAAALLAGDLDACLAAMKHAGLVQGDKPNPMLARRSALLDDLLRFWVTDEAAEARRLAGMI